MSAHEDAEAEAELARRGVSVVVPAYQAESTLAKALESVLRQEYAPLEVIVVDDASRDGTFELARRFEPRGVHALRLVRNVGPAGARNAGIAQARGCYLAFLDADDEWLPEKLERQVRAIEARPGVTLVTCDSLYVSRAGTQLRRSHQCRPPVSGISAWKTLLTYNFSPTPTVLVRRADVLATGGFDPAMRFGEDLDLWVRLALTGEVEVLPEVLVRIVEWPGSMTGRSAEGEADHVLPMVERYVTEHRARLEDEEARAILGRRLFESGVGLLYSGRPARSFGYFVRALRQGYHRGEALRYLPRAALAMLSMGHYPRRDFGTKGGDLPRL